MHTGNQLMHRKITGREWKIIKNVKSGIADHVFWEWKTV